jgi:hypothetical protein
MADNVTLNVGIGGDTIAADDVGGAKYQRVKLSLGADGTAADAPVGGGTEAGSLRVTLATDSTGLISVDDNGGSLTVDGTVAATQSGTWTVTGTGGTFPVTDSGGSLTVDGTVTATQSGTWNIGSITTLPTLAAVTTVSTVTNVATIGTSITPGTGAAHLGKAEDAAHASGDTGVMALAVRRDADTALASTDGDYGPLQLNAAGSLKVAITAGAGSGGTATADDADFTAGTTQGTIIQGVYESSPTSVTDGDVGAVGITQTRALKVSIASGGIAGIVDDAAFTPATSEVLPIGFFADESSPDSVTEGDIGAARMSLDRKQYAIAHQETSTIYQNGTARTPAFVAIDAATSGDNTLLAAQGSGNKIRVHQLYLVSSGTVNVRFESGAGGTALSGQMNLVANTGFVLPFSPIGWFETAANALLNLELSAAVSVDGNFAYTVVT